MDALTEITLCSMCSQSPLVEVFKKKCGAILKLGAHAEARATLALHSAESSLSLSFFQGDIYISYYADIIRLIFSPAILDRAESSKKHCRRPMSSQERSSCGDHHMRRTPRAAASHAPTTPTQTALAGATEAPAPGLSTSTTSSLATSTGPMPLLW